MKANTASILTETQRRQIYGLRKEYCAAGLSTLPADRATTEKIISRFYARIGRPAPSFHWFDGPLSCIVAYNVIEQFELDARVRLRGLPLEKEMKYQLRTLLRRRLAGEARSQLGDALCLELETKHWCEIEDDTQDNEDMDGDHLECDESLLWMTEGLHWIPVAPRSRFDSDVGSRVRASIRAELDGGLRSVDHVQLCRNVSRKLGSVRPVPAGPRQMKIPIPVWGGEGQCWVGHHVACECAGVRFDAGARSLLAEWDVLNRACGWWFPFERTVLCAERHLQVCFDSRSTLHNDCGPAIECRDGLKFYAWHGVGMKSEWVEQRETLDPSIALTWRNSEQRRALVEIIGWARILERVAMRVVDADLDPEIGTLLESDLPGAGPSRFLRVRCGTGREFVLSVPCEMRSAREANAWTYGLKDNEYQLEARS